jgi:hypothetical protein
MCKNKKTFSALAGSSSAFLSKARMTPFDRHLQIKKLEMIYIYKYTCTKHKNICNNTL